MYRPPSCSAEDTRRLFHMFECLLDTCTNVTILGDLNLPDVSWHYGVGLSTSSIGTSFLEIVSSWDLTQLVNEPSRGKNFLDIILTSNPAAFKSCQLCPPISSSDHSAVVCEVMLPPRIKAVQQSKPHYNFKAADFTRMAQLFSSVNWKFILSKSVDINEMWSSFSSIVFRVIAECTPCVCHDHCKALKKKHRALFLRKKRLWRKWKLKPTPENKSRLMAISKKLSCSLKNHQQNEENSLLNTSSKKFFNYVSSRFSPTEPSISLRDDKSALINDANTICELFLDEFVKNFSQPQSISIPPGLAEDSQFQFVLSQRLIFDTISKLPLSSAGPDGIPALVYRRLASQLTVPLNIIYQQSIFQGKLPDAWKIAKIMPIYKGKGDRNMASSYRPISLTNIAGKILERIVSTSLSDYLESNELLSQCQHGFRKGRSTATNMLQCDAYIADCLNKGKSIDLIMIDFQRAFDKVDHNLLLHKLNLIGISGCYLRWFANLLTGRWQFVEYNFKRSAAVPVSSGVIQGSPSGPILFNIFINDINMVVKHCQIYLFADDVKAAGELDGSKSADLIQEDLLAIERWSITNKLPISLPKCLCLHYGRNNSKRKYPIDGQFVTSVVSCMDLGILRSASFSYTGHVQSIALKVSRIIGMCMKLFSSRGKDFLVNIYKSYIRPKLEYASTVWSPTDKASNILLENVQRRFTKRIKCLSTLNYEQRLSSLGLSSLSARRQYNDVMLLYKCLHEFSNIQLTDLKISVCKLSSRGAGFRLKHYKPRSTLLASGFYCRAVKLWNSLPITVPKSNSIGAFKKATIKHFNS